MRMRMRKTIRYIALVACLSYGALLLPVDAFARGGGGGFRGGGGFGGGDHFGGSESFGGGSRFAGGENYGGGYRDESYYGGSGYGGSGYGDRGRSDLFGSGAGFGSSAYGRVANPVNNTPRVSEQQLRSAASTDYSWGSGHSLSSDGGFGKLAAAGISTGVTNRSTQRVTPGMLATSGSLVRSNYGYSGLFDHNFWAAHRDAAWADAALWGDGWAWGGGSWPDLADWWGIPDSGAPQDYDYGNNISYQGDNVYYGSQPIESAAAYYSQAQNLAESGTVTVAQASQKDAWKPLGIYSMVEGSQTNTTDMFQLAVDKKGDIKGTYYNALTQETKPVQGAVDKKNMRVSWVVCGNKSVVYDTGLSNLLQPQSSMLVHYGKDKTQQWTLVRLQQPASKS